ncbi:GNAT family N-acetyltransferase [Kribbia dieselivorans]|uniref:GNAT family N-acetyltransferase n=1 Tax=Kribbia dieselivorans TaxID=331526 RepID=UPI000839218D|nr:GNAT family N-acetyltransferase [Kribbia dieselivorans]
MTSERIVSVADLSTGQATDLYDRVFRPAFRPDELLDRNAFLSAYTGAQAQHSGVLVRQGTPIAAYLTDSYVDGRVVLLTYLAVAPSARGSGAGATLAAHLRTLLGTGGLGALTLAEVDDPRVWPGDEGTGDAVARLRFYARLGARVLPLRYFQPALRSDSDRVHGMFLIRLDAGVGTAKDLVREFLVENVTANEGPAAVQDPEATALLREVDALTPDDILPLSQWRRLPSSV